MAQHPCAGSPAARGAAIGSADTRTGRAAEHDVQRRHRAARRAGVGVGRRDVARALALPGAGRPLIAGNRGASAIWRCCCAGARVELEMEQRWLEGLAQGCESELAQRAGRTINNVVQCDARAQ
jgi:hypothetical protein